MGTGDVGHHHSPVSQPLASKSLEESYHQSVSDENAHFCESASVNEWQGLGRLTEGGQWTFMLENHPQMPNFSGKESGRDQNIHLVHISECQGWAVMLGHQPVQ